MDFVYITLSLNQNPKNIEQKRAEKLSKQERFLIGDVGSGFAQAYADSLDQTGCWAIAAPQHEEEMLFAVSTEHPDEIVLDLSVNTMDVIRFVDRLRAVSFCRVRAFFTDWNAYLIEELRSCSVVCALMPRLDDLQQAAAVNISNHGALWNIVSELMESFCLSMKMDGFHCLRMAIILRYQMPIGSRCSVMQLYSTIAEKAATRPANVERQIRDLIAQGYNLRHQLKHDFYFRAHKIPEYEISAGEFIILAAEWLHIERGDAEKYMAEKFGVGD